MIVKPPHRSSSSEEGGSAAPDIDRNIVMSMIRGSLCRREMCEGDVFRVETEVDSNPHQKRARTERSEYSHTALSTLEYDKRVADS